MLSGLHTTGPDSSQVMMMNDDGNGGDGDDGDDDDDGYGNEIISRHYGLF